MRQSLDRARRFFAPLLMSAAFLAIANVELIWQGYHRSELQENYALIKKSPHRHHLNISEGEPKTERSELSESLEQDELNDRSPFAALSISEPLKQIFQRGIVSFHRETYRSSAYREEGGYDLVSYEIEHSDSGKSSILAYLEGSPEAPEERIAFVTIIIAQGQSSHSYFFRDGQLIEQANLSINEAQSLVSKRLSQSIPFFSVSR